MKPLETEKQREDYAKVLSVINKVLVESFGGQIVGRCSTCGAMQIRWNGESELMCKCNNSLFAREGR